MCAVACGLFGIWGQLRRQWLDEELAAIRHEQWQILERLQHFQCSPEWGKFGYDERNVVRLHLVAIPPLQDAELRDDLAHLEELSWQGRQTLDLRETQVSNRGLVHLSRLRGLQELDLRQTEVTDAGLEYLKVLTKLRYLNLKGTQVSDEAVEKLQQALPYCIVEH
jgi:hypothetical protein